MQNAVVKEQIRKNDSNTYYRVNNVNKSKVTCNTRNGSRGRYSTTTTKILLNDFQKLEVVKSPKSEVKTKKNVTILPKPLEWTEEISNKEVLKILKKQNEQLRKKLIATRSGQKIIKDAVLQSLTVLPDLRIPPLPAPSNRSDKEIAVLHISDTQIGKITSTYDSGVAEERLFELITKTLKITEMRRNAADISEIRVYLGGDIVEGEDIFSHQAHTIDQSVYDQALHAAPTILGKCILRLVEHFRKVKVIAVPGNHGRNGPKGTRSHPRTNWDSVCYTALRGFLLGPDWNPRKDLRERLEFEYKSSWFSVDRVFDWGNLIVHGDQIKGGFAGFPWYGTAKKAWGWIDSIPAPWDYLWFGHFHTYAGPVTLNKRIFLANGTTESDNVFAQQQLAAAGYPCQRLCFFNKEHGLVSDNQIFLTKNRVPSKVRGMLLAQ